MDIINYYTFEDKYSQQEISKEDGSSFYKAFGIVISINSELISLNRDGILVCYRSPRADLKKEFRNLHEISLQQVDKDTWEALKGLIQGSQSIETKELYKFVFSPKDNPLPQYHSNHHP